MPTAYGLRIGDLVMASYSNSRRPTNGEDRLLRARDVADLCAVSTRQVWRWAATGVLSRVRLAGATRFRQSDVARIVASGVQDER